MATKPFYLLPPPPVLGVWFYCLTNGTPCFLRVQFLTTFRGSPYLVLLGLPYLVITLKNTRARKNWAPAANRRNHDSPDRLPSTTNSEIKKLLKFHFSSLQNSKFSNISNFSKNGKLRRNLKFFQFWKILFIRLKKINYSKTIRKSLLLSRGMDENCKQHINTYWNYQTNC